MPDFLIVGAPRSGTTTLASYLAADPEVFVARQKEVLFFDHQYDRGVDWYRAQFAATREKLAGEATPSYMYDDDAVRRMAETVPGARLVAVLREPVSRAYSSYWFRVGLGGERRSFPEMIDQELAGKARPGRFPGLLEGSTYLPALDRVATHFPRSSLHVVVLEDLKIDPERALKALRTFLGLAGPTPPLVKSVNSPYRLRSRRLRRAMLRFEAWRRLPFGLGAVIDRWNHIPFDYPPMDPAMRRRLREHFAEHNAELAAWLGRDLSLWDSPP